MSRAMILFDYRVEPMNNNLDRDKSKSAAEKRKKSLTWDFSIIVVAIGFAIWLAKSGFLDKLIGTTQNIKIFESFVAGSFFTSAFTTAPAIAVLGKIAAASSVFWTAVLGGLGALCGDLILFKFIRDRFADDLLALIGKKRRDQIRHVFHRKIFRWFTPFVAALIIASPLPDELGVTLLGFAKSRTPIFILFSYLANFTGILIIGLLARSIG